MLKATIRNSALRKRARQFGSGAPFGGHSAYWGDPQAQTRLERELGVTFIGHASFFVQIGGQNVIINPNFARWLFVLKRCASPVSVSATCQPSIWCW
jgi:hypothetical protein